MVKRPFAEVIKIRIRMRSSWVRVALNPMTGVLITDRRGETQTQRSHVNTEVDSECGHKPRDPWSQK